MNPLIAHLINKRQTAVFEDVLMSAKKLNKKNNLQNIYITARVNCDNNNNANAKIKL